MTGCTTTQVAGWLCLAQWWQLDIECIFSFILEVYLTTLCSDIFCFGEFFCDRTGRDRTGQDGTGRDSQTDGMEGYETERLFINSLILALPIFLLTL